MVEPHELEKLGLNKNEAIVFIALLEFGEATAGDLIKKTGFHRNIVYDNLEKLGDKGLVAHVIKNGVRYYMFSSPESVIELIKAEERKVADKRELAKKLTKEIEQQIKKVEIKPKSRLIQGTLGIRDIMSDTLKVSKDYIAYGAPGISSEIMGEHFWKNYGLKRKEKNIKVRLIFNDDLRAFGKTILDSHTQIRYLPKQFDTLTETTIYGNKVAIMVWTEKPITVLIEDENVAKAYSKYFEILWKMAKL